MALAKSLRFLRRLTKNQELSTLESETIHIFFFREGVPAASLEQHQRHVSYEFDPKLPSIATSTSRLIELPHTSSSECRKHSLRTLDLACIAS